MNVGPLNAGLLAPDDPHPYEHLNAQGRARVLLTCEHAGRAIPRALGDLQIDAAEMDRHIAYDIGAQALTRRLAAELDAPAVLQPYSRLVVDCNRSFEVQACVPEVSDGTVIGANLELDEAARRQRFDAIHRPFHDTITRHLDDFAPTMLVAVHSFTPRMNEIDRPWHAGLLHGHDDRAATLFMKSLTRDAPHMHIAFNEPYAVAPDEDYTIPVHGEGRGMPHLLLEVRNDQLSDEPGLSRWTGLLSTAIRESLLVLDDGR